MQIPKEQIIDMIRGRGDHEGAQQADRELPANVDTDQHGGMLEKYGIDTNQLMSRLKGNIPGL
jgi:hypothetical protein